MRETMKRESSPTMCLQQNHKEGLKKKEPEKKIPKEKAAPASAKKKRTTKKKSYGDKVKGLKQN